MKFHRSEQPGIALNPFERPHPARVSSHIMTRAFLCLLALVAFPVVAQDNWPQFRGPSGQGESTSTGLPITWSEKENVKWKTAIHGRAWSSPVVWGKQIWLTTATEDGKHLFAICVDKDSGKIVHDLKLFEVAEPQFAHKFNTYGSPTPAIEEGRVYITFGSPGTACLDTATGKVVWQRTDFVCNHFRGAGSSPVIYKDLLLMNFDGSDYQFVVALNKKTGETVWKTDRSIDFKDLDPSGKPAAEGDFRKAFSTPRVIEVDGKPMMISLGSKACYAYDPDTGKELWRTEERTNHSGSVTPLYGHGLVFTATGLARGEFWAIKPEGRGFINDTHVAWRVKRSVPSKPSPVLVGDHIYMVDDGGVGTCLEAKTGKEVWRERIGGNQSASPITADGKVYFFNEDGRAVVIEAKPQFKLLADNQLEGGFMASPAVTGNALILRTKTHLYRIEK